tara:strand:+ start:1042 stop:2733 length:1692 start_codon:yes stop_codon:yes gene_type:complete
VDISTLNELEGSRVICLFLAQNENPKKPHEQLGFYTAQSAFEEIGKLFQRQENTIKNERDAFDFYTDSPRVGWKNSLKPSLQFIWKNYGTLSRSELLDMSLNILEKKRSNIRVAQPNIFDLVSGLGTKTKLNRPDANGNIRFSNMQEGEAREWYSMSVAQILGCLEDYKKPEFQNIDTSLPYNDERWRRTHYKTYFSDEVMRTLGGAQGSSVFSVLAKLIQVANDRTVHHKLCAIDIDALNITIARITKDVSHSEPQESDVPQPNQITVKIGGENMIFYGAPGTGKSTELKRRIGNSPNVTTVFHPDMQNSDFIGTLKPAVDGENVTYKFSPGPFAKALRSAYNQPEQNVYLVIEELNRAPAMAVFGELFQLLDREDNGESTYEVDFPSDEFQAWLTYETNVSHAKIKLPSNLSIYASMNSADQGVYPLDTAFRRRWEQEYMPIDWSKGLESDLIIVKADGSEARVPWKILGKAINDELEERYAEDRLLGQWWINNRDIQNSNDLVPSKLLNYLWDDLLRHDEDIKKKIFKPDIKRFGQLMQRNHGNLRKQIFSDYFLQKIAH